MVVLLMSRMALPLSAPLWQQNGNYSICKLGEVLTWGFFWKTFFLWSFFSCFICFCMAILASCHATVLSASSCGAFGKGLWGALFTIRKPQKKKSCNFVIDSARAALATDVWIPT